MVSLVNNYTMPRGAVRADTESSISPVSLSNICLDRLYVALHINVINKLHYSYSTVTYFDFLIKLLTNETIKSLKIIFKILTLSLHWLASQAIILDIGRHCMDRCEQKSFWM